MYLKSGIYILAFTLFISISPYANGDLYNSSDPMVILNVNNFYNTTLGTEKAWIIEFYASWCGHCINFAPTWRDFSYEVMDWDHTIKVGALDCADEENGPICRDYNVTSYPTIKLFGARTQKGDFGSPVLKGYSLDLQQAIITFLTTQENNNLGSDSWVDLMVYDDAVKNLLYYAPGEAEHGIIIVEDADSIIASQSILDLGNYPLVYVRRMNWESPELDAFDLPGLPSIIVVDRSGNYEILGEDVTTREEITALIIHNLQLKKKTVNRVGGNVFRPNQPSDNKVRVSPAMPDYQNTDQVYMVDIENTLSYAFNHEVALNRVIAGEDLGVLINFTDVLVKYLPTRPQVHSFLMKLNEYLRGRTSITGDEFEDTLSDLESAGSVLPELHPWKGCMGSKPQYRGYPCGLWTMFHTLTVNAVLREEDNPAYDPMKVMRAIHGFVKNFFGCAQCSEHFQAMYAQDAESFVHRANDEIMWLWKSHNKVNERLQGDLGEDPKHLKQLFPTKQRCPQCWNADDSFNQENVSDYLKMMYGEDAISYIGVEDLSKSGAHDYMESGSNRAFIFSSTYICIVALSLLQYILAY